MSWKKVSLITITFIALLLCISLILFATSWGTKKTVNFVNNITGIQIEYQSGALLNELELKSIHISDNDTKLYLSNIQTSINLSCAWRKALCVNSLSVNDLQLSLSSAQQEEPMMLEDSLSEHATFSLPIKIELKEFTVKNTQLSVDENTVIIDDFSTSLSMHNSKLDVINPKISKLSILLAETEDKPQNNVASATLNDKLPEVILPIDLNIHQLLIDKLSINNKDISSNLSNNESNSLEFFHNSLSASWQKEVLTIANLQSSSHDFSYQVADTQIKLSANYEIHAKLIAKVHKLPLWPEIEESTFEASLIGNLERLKMNVISTGSLSMQANGTVDLVNSQLPFNLSLSTKELPLPLSFKKYGQPTSIDIKINGDMAAQNIILNSNINNYGYHSGKLSLKAKHELNAYKIDSFIFEDDLTNSKLDAQGYIDVTPQLFQWSFQVNSSGFTLPNIDLTPLIKTQSMMANLNMPEVLNGRLFGQINTTGNWSDTDKLLSISDSHIEGEINDSAVKLQGDFTLNQQGINHQNITTKNHLLIEFDQDKLTLQGDTGNEWGLAGKIHVEDISRWYKAVKGTLISDFVVTGEQSNPEIKLNSQVTDLNFQQLRSPFLSIDLTYQPFSNHKSQIKIYNENLQLSADDNVTEITTATIEILGDINHHNLTANWQGDIEGMVELSGEWTNSDKKWTGVLPASYVTFKDISLKNNQSFSIDFDLEKELLSIDSHCWVSDELNLCLPENTTFGQTGTIAIDMTVNSSLIDKIWQIENFQLTGETKGQLSATWSPEQDISAQADFKLSTGHITVFDNNSTAQEILKWQQGGFSVELQESTLKSSLTLSNAKHEDIINNELLLELSESYPIQNTLKLNHFNLQTLQPMVDGLSHLSGDLSAEFSILGSVGSPTINGKIALQKGEVTLARNPNAIDNISALIEINNNIAELNSAFFIDNNKASLIGQLGWEDEFFMALKLDADFLPIYLPPELTTNVSPALSMSYRNNVLSIDGDIDVLGGSYEFLDVSSETIILSDDVVFIQSDGSEESNSSSLAIDADININIKEPIELSGLGIQSNLVGQLKVKQNPKQPLQIFGTVRAENGTYNAYGQRLFIDFGEVTFNGSVNNPYLNLKASRKINSENIEVGINITGASDDLNMTLFSSPRMENPEILSYLTRGRGLDSAVGSGITASMTNILLNSSIKQTGILKLVEQTPLITNISVDTESEGNSTQATVSGYVGNHIYLKYGVGIEQPINELTVRLFLINRIWLEIVSGLEQSTDIYFSYEID